MQNDLILNSENDYYSVISDEKDIRLDVFISEKIGVTSQPVSTNCRIIFKQRDKVQNEPVIATPIFLPVRSIISPCQGE